MENKVARTNLRRADFEQWGLSEGCPGCRYLTTGQERQQAHSEACRRRIERLLKGDQVWSARLAAAGERRNRALADAVERHATKDPGERGILKWSSVVCHALDTQQDPTPHHSVSHTEDHQRQAHDQASPQGLHRTTDTRERSERNTSMATSRWKWTVRTKTVRDTQTRRDQTPEGGSRRRGNHGKQGMSNQRVEPSSTTELHVPRRLFGKTTLQGHAVAVRGTGRKQ